MKPQPRLDNREDLPSRETLIAALLYLMSRFSQSSDVDIARSIVKHLQLLETHPDRESSVIERTAARLRKLWAQHCPETVDEISQNAKLH